MFRKRGKPKNSQPLKGTCTGKSNATSNETATTSAHADDDEDVSVSLSRAASRKNKSGPDRGVSFSSGPARTKARLSSDSTGGSSSSAAASSTRVFESSRDAEPTNARDFATAEAETDTSYEHDARAILERKSKAALAAADGQGGNDDGQLNLSAKIGGASTAGVSGSLSFGVGRTALTAEQIARNKITGILGPIRAPKHLRMTNRFDYQPDICKDYKETGYCGFGDSCIFMHDRSDYKAGWQLEKEWDEKQKEKADRLARGLGEEDAGGADADDNDDDPDAMPFACHICRQPFTNPIVTSCKHYFCQKCALKRFKKTPRCAVCGDNTKGIFNAATDKKTKGFADGSASR